MTRAAAKPISDLEFWALRHFMRRHGRSWRRHLGAEWERACSGISVELQQPLQELRNRLGPTWLRRVKVPDPWSGPGPLVAFINRVTGERVAIPDGTFTRAVIRPYNGDGDPSGLPASECDPVALEYSVRELRMWMLDPPRPGDAVYVRGAEYTDPETGRTEPHYWVMEPAE